MVFSRSRRRYLASVKFGKEVRRRRKALAMTIEELAERSGLTPNYVGTVEIGDRDPSLSTLVALARGLSVSPGELVGGFDRLSPAALEAARLFEGVGPDVQEAVVRLLRTLQKKKR
jgi:transcriptional regulator with XRE-family HTH domain